MLPEGSGFLKNNVKMVKITDFIESVDQCFIREHVLTHNGSIGRYQLAVIYEKGSKHVEVQLWCSHDLLSGFYC